MSAATLKGLLEALLPRVAGLQAVYVTDKDGVVIESAGNGGAGNGSTAEAAQQFVVSAEQASKMGVGRTRTITAIYADRVLVHVNAYPLVVSFVAAPDANIGMVHSLCPELVHALEPFHATVEAVSQ